MGEVVVSSKGRPELLTPEAEMAEDPAELQRRNSAGEVDGSAAAGASSSTSIIRWERFLPKMAVRVLLVEADDSTRQIVAALLRKCSYKVAAVSDGLKAWEVLKGRLNNIDLILTEVELPSISGYALLTLIREHDICKNIPVVMMSSHDSVTTVYKCMLRGAADFLIKPVRKNELMNLWQHVWRRQASRNAAAVGPPDESVAQQKIEATAENNATSNHSSGYMACIERNREGIEKGSDAQSSCTKPEVETEGADIEHIHCLSQPVPKCLANDLNILTQEECHQESRKTQAQDTEAGESRAVASVDANFGTTQRGDLNSGAGWKTVNATGPTFLHNCLLNNPSREVIDLIGAIDGKPKDTFQSPDSNASTNKFDILPQLDLSLRRSHPSSSVNQVNDETRRLNHSDASAFSRYISKPLQSHNSTSPSTCNQQKDHEANSVKQLSNHPPDYNSDTHGPTSNAFRPGLPEVSFRYPQQKEIGQPIPVKGVRFENVMNGFVPVMPQMCCVPSGLSPLPSPTAAGLSQPFTQHNPFYPSDCQPSGSQKFNNFLDQRVDNAVDQADNRNGKKCENLEDQSTGNDQTGSNSFYNSHLSHHHSIGSGSNGKINFTLVKGMPECGSEDGFRAHEGTSHRTLQREVALTKFRMKRKERCFEKKVRYESRKKLAEQRPRVKGQFIRQVPSDTQPGSSSAP